MDASNLKVVISVHAHGLAFRMAEELNRKGALEKIYTIYPHFKLREYDIPKNRMKNWWIFGALKYVNRFIGNKISNDALSKLFGKMVARDLKRPKDSMPWIFHGFSGYCEWGMKKAKELGAVTVVERGCPHIDYQRELIAEEKSHLLRKKVEPEWKPTYARMKREYETADYILLPSNYSRKSFIEHGFNPEHLIVVPLCNEKATEPPKEPKHLEKFTVLCIGGHFYRKGMYYLLEAWRKLDIKDAELIIRGDVPKKFAELRSIPNVRWITHHLSNADLIELYKQSHIAIIPSIDDGFAMVTVEALRAGLPVIVTNHVGASDIIENGKDGFVVQAGSSAAIVEKIKFFLENPKEIERMSKSAIAKAAKYSPEKFIERTLAAYERMIEQKN